VHLTLVEGVALMLLFAAAMIVVWLWAQLVASPPPAPSVMRDEPRNHAADPAAWSERLVEEGGRCVRYERPASVVVIRLEVLDKLVAAAAGTVDRARLCRAVVASLRRSARDSDVVYGDGRGTFRVLLVETDEFGARAYVDRVAVVLKPWIETVDSEVGLTAVWAGTSELTDLPAADRLADARLIGARDGWIRSAFVQRLARGATWFVPGLSDKPFADGVSDQGGRPAGPELLR
jgi:GGDEF domain-containing protein